ncbi:MAG: glycosyltransferase family 4 protein, partial [Crenarchaeota archaeon]|nr:glycosyltransferase family 4 protein [Thermoproteota archaeon]
SRITKSKGWDVLVSAIEHLPENIKKNMKILFIGEGPDEQELKNVIKKMKINNLIDLIGPVKQDLLPFYYRKMDVFIFPTTGESLGLVALEAMACGIPVVATNVRGPRDYIIDNQNGFLFNLNDSRKLSEIIEYIYKIKNTEKYNELVKNAIIKSDEYKKKYVSKKLVNIFNELYIDNLK